MAFNEGSIKQLVAVTFIFILLAFTFLIIRPIFFPIIIGLILAYVFAPVYAYLLKFVKNETLAASITSVFVVILIGLLTWFFVPILLSQIFNIYNVVVSFDGVGFFKKFMPFLFASDQISVNFAAAYSSFISSSTKSVFDLFTNYLINLPSLLLKFAVIALVFFYGLRDGEKLLEIVKNTLPFNKSLTNRFIQKSKEVTFSVVYGRIIIGILTGILTGISFYLAGVPNSTILTVIAIFAGVIPIIGTWIVWIPVVVTLFASGNNVAAFLLLIYNGLFVSFFDHITHPLFISKKSRLPTSLTLIGMIGGLLVFGVFGIILGPLIVGYITTLFEIYLEYNAKKT